MPDNKKSILSSTPPHFIAEVQSVNNIKKIRNSNIELYRVIVMFLIVAHHYIVNSGITLLIPTQPIDKIAMGMLLFGAWGKTGINCFVLITGYYMCTSSFSWKKLLKLYLQVAFYTIIIYLIFCLSGHEEFSPFLLFWKMFPIKNISDDFTSCFLLFYLFIPFLNIFIKNLNKKEHKFLVFLIIIIFTILPSFPFIRMSFNYVTWFIAIYIIASYLRFYGKDLNVNHKQWGYLSLISILLGALSVVCVTSLFKYKPSVGFHPYFFISDSNKFLSLLIAVSTFMWFKDLKLKYIPIINLIGATTFGILLIHANSETMRQWLWKETIDCIGHLGPSLIWNLCYAIYSVSLIFLLCSAIELLRKKYIERHFFNIIYNFINKRYINVNI